MKKLGLLLFVAVFQIALGATNGFFDADIPGYTHKQILEQANDDHTANNDYTLIDYDYKLITAQSEKDVGTLLKKIDHLSLTEKIQILAESPLIDNHPYLFVGAEGEGNWCGINNSKTCSHIQQDPIFRTDQYNCTTLVSMILALIHAKTADNFNKTIVKIEYGAAGKLKDPIHYYNRNNFTSSAFNPINEANHYLENATFKTPFYTIKTVSSVINVQQWLAFQKRASVIQNNIRVLDANNGPTMLARFLNDYPPNLMPLQPQTVTLSYIPKHNLVSCTSLGCTENEIAINALPTPAVIEIVRDDKLWLVDGKPINKLIGSGINVSHIGIIFRKTFIMGAVIYQRITCSLQNQKKVCEVTPIKCNHQLCREVMMLQATDAYPNGYYFYQTHGNYQCTAQKPKSDNAGYTRCNRVLVMPLGDYLSQYEYGIYPFMMAPSIVGLHLEKINY